MRILGFFIAVLLPVLALGSPASEDVSSPLPAHSAKPQVEPDAAEKREARRQEFFEKQRRRRERLRLEQAEARRRWRVIEKKRKMGIQRRADSKSLVDTRKPREVEVGESGSRPVDAPSEDLKGAN